MSDLPTFLVVGAAKSGTTSLHYFMEQHPEICVPPCKETYIFNRESMAGTWPAVNTFDEKGYRELFQTHTTEKTKAWGEVTTSNLYYHEEAVPEIQKLLGNPQIVILIRNPVDRAYSNWTYTSASYGEPLSFEEAKNNAFTVKIDDLSINVISLKDLRINKLASGRSKDLADLDNLPLA